MCAADQTKSRSSSAVSEHGYFSTDVKLMINLPPESEEEQEDSFLSERLIDLYIKHWHRGSVGVRGGLQSIWSLDTQAYFLIQARTKRNLQTFPSLVGAGGEVKVVGVTPTSLYSSVHMKCGGGDHG